MKSDAKLDNVTSVPLISDVKRYFEILLKIRIVEESIKG